MNLNIKVLNPNRRNLKFVVVVLPDAAKHKELSYLRSRMTSCLVSSVVGGKKILKLSRWNHAIYSIPVS